MSADDCVRLGIDDDGKRVALRLGERLCIDLPENPTTGFRWRAPHVDTDVVVLDEDRFELSSANPGAGGVRHFRFVAIASGATNIAVRQGRAWETDAKPEYTVAVAVRVRAG